MVEVEFDPIAAHMTEQVHERRDLRVEKGTAASRMISARNDRRSHHMVAPCDIPGRWLAVINAELPLQGGIAMRNSGQDRFGQAVTGSVPGIADAASNRFIRRPAVRQIAKVKPAEMNPSIA